MTAVSCGPIPRPRSGWASRPGTCARAISPVCRRFARTSPRSSNRPVRHSAPWWPWDARSARAALRPARPLVGRDPDAHALGPAAPGTGGQGLAGTGSGLRAHARPRAQEPAGERTRRRPADPAGKQSRCGRGTGPGHHPGRRPDHPARRSLEPGRRYPPGRAQRGQSQPSRGQRHGQPDPRRRIREGDPEGRFRPSLPAVYGDRDLLLQVVLNLLQNALDAVRGTPQPKIRIETRFDTGPRSRTGANPTPLVLVVRDNGPGIPETLGSGIFTPFVTTKPAGEGLGLAFAARHRRAA